MTKLIISLSPNWIIVAVPIVGRNIHIAHLDSSKVLFFRYIINKYVFLSQVMIKSLKNYWNLSCSTGLVKTKTLVWNLFISEVDVIVHGLDTYSRLRNYVTTVLPKFKDDPRWSKISRLTSGHTVADTYICVSCLISFGWNLISHCRRSFRGEPAWYSVIKCFSPEEYNEWGIGAKLKSSFI